MAASKPDEYKVGDQPEYTVKGSLDANSRATAVFYDADGRVTAVPAVAAPKLTDKDDEEPGILFKVPYAFPTTGEYSFVITVDGKTTTYDYKVVEATVDARIPGDLAVTPNNEATSKTA